MVFFIWASDAAGCLPVLNSHPRRARLFQTAGVTRIRGIVRCHGFAQFSKMKPVFRQARLNGLGLFRAPYGKRFEAMMKLLR
jgi:hypothetical protein